MVNGHPVTCASCGTEFPSYAASERHRDETGHARFEAMGNRERNPPMSESDFVELDGVRVEVDAADLITEVAWLISNSESVIGLRSDGQPMTWLAVMRSYMPSWAAGFSSIVAGGAGAGLHPGGTP